MQTAHAMILIAINGEIKLLLHYLKVQEEKCETEKKKGARVSAASLFCSTQRGLPCIYIAYRTVFFIKRILFVKHFWLGAGDCRHSRMNSHFLSVGVFTLRCASVRIATGNDGFSY